MASTYTVQVIPDASGWVGKVKAQLDPVTRQIADDIKRDLQRAVREGLNGSGVDGRVQGRRLGSDVGDAFERAIKDKLRRAMANLPEGKARLLIDGSPAQRELAKVRAELSRLADANIGVDLEDKAALARIDELKLRLFRLTGPEHDIRMRVNSAAALAELEALKLAVRDVADKGSKLSGLGSSLSGTLDEVPVGGIAKISGIVLALSTVGPLAAAASGALLGVAGAAGVAGLAVLGLKKQMSEQTGFGEQISHTVKSITAEVGGLAQVAANAVGPAIRDVLGLVHNVIPTFEGLVNLVGGNLGGAFREVGRALVTIFERAQPLIVDVSGYILQGAAAFEKWTVSPSFSKFIDYARQQLPIIIQDAVDFGRALITTFVNLAPTGEVVLKIIDLIAKALSSVSPGGLSIFGSLFGGDDKKKANDAASTIDKLLGSYQELFTGTAQAAAQAAPLDNYTKVIGDLVTPLQFAYGATKQFDTAVAGITDRLKSAAPALQTFMNTAASYDASTAKVADTAKLLGDALTASRGNALDYAAAISGADVATQGLAKALHDNAASVAKDGTLLGVSHLDAAGKFVDASNKYSAGSAAIISGFQQQVKAATDAATATYTNEKATRGQAQAANDALTVYKGYRQSLIDSAVAAGTARSEATKLADQYFAIPPDVDTFVKLLGQNDVSVAIQGLTDALNRLSDFIGAPTIGLNKTDFDNSSAIAQSQLDYFGHTIVLPSLDLSAGAFNSKAQSAADRLAILSGLQAAPSVTLRDQATDKLVQIQGQLFNLRDRTIVITTIQRLVQQGAAANNANRAGAFSAYGNIIGPVAHYAMGGIVDKLKASLPSFARGSENHVPQIAMPNGGFRVWAEPETQGEAYIPFAMDRRERATDILGDVAQRFGYGLIPAVSPSAVAAAPSGAVGGPVEIAGTVAIDLPGVGTLNGHMTGLANGAISRREADVRLQTDAGRSSRLS